MNDIEKDAYYTYMKEVLAKRDIVSAAEARGEIKKAKNIAIQMLKEGLSIELISKLTSLTVNEINEL